MQNNRLKNIEPILERLNFKILFERGWPQEPIHLKKPFGASIYNELWFFEALKTCQENIEKKQPADLLLHDKNGICKSGYSNSARTNTGLSTLLPAEFETSLQAYCNRLTQLQDYRTFSIMLDQPHTKHESIWSTTRQILRHLFMHLDMPDTRIRTDAFIGNYDKTHFGVHRDKLHNMMFMVSGKRSMRLWPGDSRGSIFDSINEGTTNYQEYIEQSTLFELEAGDILLWNASHYHIGEGNGELSVSFNIDYMHGNSNWLNSSIAESVQMTAKNITAMCKDDIDKLDADINKESKIRSEIDFKSRLAPTLKKVSTVVESSMVHAQITKNIISRLSSQSLDTRPLAIKNIQILEDSEFTIDNRFPIYTIEQDDKLYIGFNGDVLIRQNTISWLQVIELLNSGVTQSVSSLLQHLDKQHALDDKIPLITSEELQIFVTALVANRTLFLLP